MKKIIPLGIRAALSANAPTLDFVLPGLTAGSVGTVVGAGGVGKTMLLTQLGMAVATGSPAFDNPLTPRSTPARVVLIAAEESSDILRIRLHAIKKWMDLQREKSSASTVATESEFTALLEKNLLLVPAAGQSVSLVNNGATTEFFETLCKFCTGARLVLIDPLRRLHDGDENSSSSMTHIVQVLEALARHTGAAVIVAHHVSKASMFNAVTDSAAASRGSSALTDAVRWQANLSGMSETIARKHGLTGQHKSYVCLDFAKANYIAPELPLWLKRLEGGVLTQTTSKGVSAAKQHDGTVSNIEGTRATKERNYGW
ncbi:AAA family ATPase [Massilia sp. TWR1-2-2]|uniref:AAA family ATPase n=1 Tax=Massilia sp. TWR1-2-2 TaxID=2804584 RepID=UPI003CF66C94